MGCYTRDAAILAEMNCGLPPDEQVGVVCVMDEREQAALERKMAAADHLAHMREVQRWRDGWPADR